VSRLVQVHVSLLGEGVDVWRPIQAEHLGGSVYRIVAQPYDREVETWEFEPGELVVCEYVESSEGSILAATKRAADGGMNRT
jgi:hypothetical protein